MSQLRAIGRMIASIIILVTATLLVVGLSWIPITIKGVRLSAWFFTLGTKLLLPSLGLRFHCDDPQRVIQHRGFIFPNHTSYMDIIVMSYLLPMRFIAKIEVRNWPFIGHIAAATGTVFVNRSDKTSRAQAREAVAEAVAANPYPSVVVFPEGTRNSAPELLPFRYGAFEIAAGHSIPYLLCAIVYERPELITFQSHDEGLMSTVWRMVKADSSRVELIPLAVVHPSPTDDSHRLAEEARETIGQAIKAANGRLRY